MTDLPTALLRAGTALLAPLTDPASRTFVLSLGLGAVVAASVLRARGVAWRDLGRAVVPAALWTHRSTRLDLQLLLARRLIGVLGAVPAVGGTFGLAVAVAAALDARLGPSPDLGVPVWLAGVIYTVVLFVAWDASRYALHRCMHTVPALWALHQVHHSAEVLTPLTFHRVHPLESALYQLRGALVTGPLAGLFWWAFRGEAVEATLLGVHAGGFVLNAVFGNLRHSHVWLTFGPRWERWWISPAQHQLHHGVDRADQEVNYGTWLAVWDRWGGTLRVADAPPRAVGLADADRNHRPDDLGSVLVAPVRAAVAAAWQGLRPRRLAMASVLLASMARAEDAPGEAPAQSDPQAAPVDTSAEAPAVDVTDDDALEVVVERRGGVPRVAGSAHVIDEAELERQEYDDVHQVLARVPGVYVRGEDGFGLRPNIGMRGANSDRSAKITLMEDGVLFAPAPYAAPAAYFFPMMQRLVGLEVFKGPAATRFGPQTIGGALNLLTRPVPDHLTGQLDIAGGMYGTMKAHAWGGVGGPRWGALVEGVHLSTQGFKHLPDDEPTGFGHQEAMVKLRFTTDPELHVVHAVELKGTYTHEQSHETYLGVSLEDFAADPYGRYAASAGDVMRFHRTGAQATWRVDIGRAVDVRTTLYHHWLARAWTKVNRFDGGPDLHDLLLAPSDGLAGVYQAVLRGDEDSAGPDETLLIGTNDRTFHSGGLQSVVRWRASRGIVSSQLEVGVRLHADDVVRVHTEDPYVMRDGHRERTDGPTSTILDAHSVAQALAVHVHEDLGVGPVRVLPGVRVEAIRSFLQPASADPVAPSTQVIALPGLGVFGQATWWLDVFGGVYRGFSPVAPGSAADTRPETAWNYEVGARATLRHTRLEAVGFLSDYANITGQCTLSGGCSEAQLDTQFNGGKALVFGVEAVAHQDVPLPRALDLGMELTYTYTGSRFATSFVSAFPQYGSVQAGDALPYVPVHQGAARLVLSHDRFHITLAGNYRGAMRDVAGQGELVDTERVPAAFTLDVAADVALSKVVSLYATVNNATNAVNLVSFRPFGARPQAPITALFGLKVGAPGR
ncbi:MAG: TonB-dependent receptor [Alphaproteobacteria bacterium]|nr:TonB-dependent receptor [Alphaproteobacteria bacterium]